MKIILIDDMRDIDTVVKDYLSLSAWTARITRTFNEGIEALAKEGPYDVLFLDHDLACYDEQGREKTGYDVMCFLEANPELMPKSIICISQNPVGRKKIESVIYKLRGERK